MRYKRQVIDNHTGNINQDMINYFRERTNTNLGNINSLMAELAILHGVSSFDAISPDEFLTMLISDGRVNPIFDFTRYGKASYFYGNELKMAAENQIRIENSSILLEESSTNFLKNSTNMGAKIGKPGILPQNWYISNINGLTREIVDIGNIGHLPHIDIRFFGIPTSLSIVRIINDSNKQVMAKNDEIWTVSQYVQIVAGNIKNITQFFLSVIMRDKSGNYLSEKGINYIKNLSSTRIRLDNTVKIYKAKTNYINFYNYLICSANKPVDITLRFAGMQLEKSSIATSFIPTFGDFASRAADILSLDKAKNGWYDSQKGKWNIQLTKDNKGKFEIIEDVSKVYIGKNLKIKMLEYRK